MTLWLFLSLYLFPISRVMGSEYEFKLSNFDDFVEDNHSDVPESRIGLLDPETLQKLCREAAKVSIDVYNYYVQVVDGQATMFVTLAVSYKTIFGLKNDTLRACKCPSQPVIYLVDGSKWRKKILFMISGYREGDQTKIHGLRLSQWKEYFEHLKKKVHQHGKDKNQEPKNFCSIKDTEKLKEDVSSFSKKKHKGRKKHHYVVLGTENEEEEYEGNSSSSGGNEDGEEQAAEEEGVAEALGGEAAAEALTVGGEEAIAEGACFGGMFSGFMEFIQGIHFEIPEFELPEFELPDFK